MNNYHKLLAVAVFGILIIPQITLAAWWNPFSWNIFSSSQPNPQVQVISTTTSPANFISTSTSVIATTSINIVATSTLPASQPVKKIVQKVSPPVATPPTPVQVEVPKQIQPTGTLCNGTYFSECPVGQNLICPQTGNAYCQAPQLPNSIPAPQQIINTITTQTRISSTSVSDDTTKDDVYEALTTYFEQEPIIRAHIDEAIKDEASAGTQDKNPALMISIAQSAIDEYKIASDENINNQIPATLPTDLVTILKTRKDTMDRCIDYFKSDALVWLQYGTNLQNGISGQPNINLLQNGINNTLTGQPANTSPLNDLLDSGTKIYQWELQYFGLDFLKAHNIGEVPMIGILP